MKLFDASFIVVFIVLAAIASLSIVATKLFKMENDNIIEESVEELIESHTGIEIDLSPEKDTGGFLPPDIDEKCC